MYKVYKDIEAHEYVVEYCGELIKIPFNYDIDIFMDKYIKYKRDEKINDILNDNR